MPGSLEIEFRQNLELEPCIVDVGKVVAEDSPNRVRCRTHTAQSSPSRRPV